MLLIELFQKLYALWEMPRDLTIPLLSIICFYHQGKLIKIFMKQLHTVSQWRILLIFYFDSTDYGNKLSTAIKYLSSMAILSFTLMLAWRLSCKLQSIACVCSKDSEHLGGGLSQVLGTTDTWKNRLLENKLLGWHSLDNFYIVPVDCVRNPRTLQWKQMAFWKWTANPRSSITRRAQGWMKW